MTTSLLSCLRQRLIVGTASALCGAVLLSAPAHAQGSYPDKPIRLVVGFPAGTATDTVARLVAQRLTETKGWTVVVDNKTGVSGSLAAGEVARAAPNGYTLLLSAAGPLATNPNLYKNITYDTMRDFTPIARVADISYVIVVGAGSPAKSLQDLIALVKSKPGELNFGSIGVGSTQHLIAATFLSRAGLSMKHIPYKGSVDVLSGALAGDVAFYVDTAVAAAPQVTAGRLRALGVTSARRVSNLPDLPTLDQQGLKGFDMPNWLVLVGPANMPAPVIEVLSREVNGMVRTEDFRARLVKLGSEPRGDMSSAEIAAFIKSELGKWKQALDDSGAKAE